MALASKVRACFVSEFGKSRTKLGEGTVLIKLQALLQRARRATEKRNGPYTTFGLNHLMATHRFALPGQRLQTTGAGHRSLRCADIHTQWPRPDFSGNV